MVHIQGTVKAQLQAKGDGLDQGGDSSGDAKWRCVGWQWWWLVMYTDHRLCNGTEAGALSRCRDYSSGLD